MANNLTGGLLKSFFSSSGNQPPNQPPAPPPAAPPPPIPPPTDPIAALWEAHREQVKAIQQALQTHSTERKQVGQQLTDLQAQFTSLTQQVDNLQTELEALVSAYPRQELELIQAQLHESYLSFEAAAPFWRQLIDLQNQRQALLEQDPELEVMLKAFRDTDKIFESSLSQFALPYQAVLKAKHEELGRRVKPHIVLEETEQALRHDQPVILRIYIAQEPIQGQLGWIIPLPPDLDGLPPGVADPLERIALVILNSLVTLTRDPAWTFDHISTGDWVGCAMLLAEANYNGAEGLPELTKKLLQDRLLTDPLLGRVQLEIAVGDISSAAWALGRQEIYPPLPSELEEPEPALVTVEEPGLPLAEITSGWYLDDDVKSWARRVEVASGSLWNEQARRLRTLLLRMIARGMIESEGVLFDTLWRNLPEPHREAMHAGLEALRQRGLLQEIEPENGTALVSLNPRMLSEVQDLINRDVTDFWVNIINPEISTHLPENSAQAAQS